MLQDEILSLLERGLELRRESDDTLARGRELFERWKKLTGNNRKVTLVLDWFLGVMAILLVVYCFFYKGCLYHSPFSGDTSDQALVLFFEFHFLLFRFNLVFGVVNWSLTFALMPSAGDFASMRGAGYGFGSAVVNWFLVWKTVYELPG